MRLICEDSNESVTGVRRRRKRGWAFLVNFVFLAIAFGNECALRAAEGAEAPSAPADPQAASPKSTTPQDDVLSALKDALERNTREIQALKDQHAIELETLRAQSETQRKKIEELERKSQTFDGQLMKAQAPAKPAEAGAQNNDELERLRKRTDLQQRQIDVLEKQSKLLAEQVKTQGPTDENLQSLTATLEARSQQAAQRDEELANAHDDLLERVDALQRTPPQLPSTLKELFLPSQTNETPISIYNTISTIYNNFTHNKGAGEFQFQEYTPFFLIQLNKRFLLSAELSFNQGGVGLGQAQLDILIKDWLTADVGYFLAPIGFWSERLDPRWINKLPDIPLVMRQVIPDGLTITGLQFRGASYILGSPVKMEYSAFATNGLGVPGAGAAADWADLGGLLGTTANANAAMAYGGRLGIWLPARGINFGVSEFVNAPYTRGSGALVSVWQPYFNYHYGNWDARFEYGDMYERTQPFIGNNISRFGMYSQLAYRNYQSMNKYLQRLETVFRFSEARFHGIEQAKIDPTTFGQPMDAPVNRNQYAVGFNYYFYPSTILKVAYEFNQELMRNFKDDIFMVQFATNF